MFYDEDFYAEPSEFSEEIEALKEKLAASVQQKFLNEMDALRKENEALQEFRSKKASYDRELEQIKSQCATKLRRAEMEASIKRLKDLLSQFSVTGYRVKAESTQGPKCDKCDENRKIHFVSPTGRNMTEDCLCAARILHYSPKEVPLVSFIAADEPSRVYFERTDEDRDYDRYDLCANLYDKDKTQPFEEINQYRVVFLKREDCERFCAWLNEQERKKRDNKS